MDEARVKLGQRLAQAKLGSKRMDQLLSEVADRLSAQ
jgi:hypothetical protein